METVLIRRINEYNSLSAAIRWKFREKHTFDRYFTFDTTLATDCATIDKGYFST